MWNIERYWWILRDIERDIERYWEILIDVERYWEIHTYNKHKVKLWRWPKIMSPSRVWYRPQAMNLENNLKKKDYTWVAENILRDIDIFIDIDRLQNRYLK